MATAPPVIVLSGAGGGAPDLEPFRVSAGKAIDFKVLRYPCWQRYLDNDFDFAALVNDLVHQIEEAAPCGPVRMIGFSIGAHFGYAAAIKLHQRGRQISSFCAVDAFMVRSADASPGWARRFAQLCTRLLTERRFGDLTRVARSRLWRALLRLSNRRLIATLKMLASHGFLEILLAIDPFLEQELTMRLLIQVAAPGFSEIDRAPVAVVTSAILLRTPLSADSDQDWRLRCPTIKICEIAGDHDTVFCPENLSIGAGIFWSS